MSMGKMVRLGFFLLVGKMTSEDVGKRPRDFFPKTGKKQLQLLTLEILSHRVCGNDYIATLFQLQLLYY